MIKTQSVLLPSIPKVEKSEIVDDDFSDHPSARRMRTRMNLHLIK
jgi:hypothetical protein